MKKSSLFVTALLAAAVINAGEKDVTAKTVAQPKAAVAKKAPQQLKLTPEMIKKIQQQMQMRQAKPIDWSFLPATVAEINGKKFSKQDLIKWSKGKIPPRATTAMLKKYASNLVDQFITEKLLTSLATDAGFKPSQKLAEDIIKSNMKRMKIFNPEMMAKQNEALAKRGMTLEQAIKQQAANPMLQTQAATFAWAQSKNKITAPTDAEIKDFYDKNKDNPQINQILKLKTGDPVDAIRASHILILTGKNGLSDKAAKAKAEEVLAKLKKGEKFEDLAKANSGCPSGKKGGSLGAFKKDKMVKPFSDAAAKLKVGEISGLVKTRFGYHIIRRDKLKKEQYASYDSAKNKIAQYIMMNKESASIPKFIGDELKKAKADQKVKNLLKPAVKAQPKVAAKPPVAVKK